LGAARRVGDELAVLDGTADVLERAISDDISGATGKERVGLSGSSDHTVIPCVLGGRRRSRRLNHGSLPILVHDAS
jgi:hypothetical protein